MGRTGATLPEKLKKEMVGSVFKFKKRQLAASIFLSLVGLSMLAVSFLPSVREASVSRDQAGVSLHTFLAVGGATFAFLGTLAIFLITRNSSRRLRIVWEIENRPWNFAWVFLENIRILKQGGAPMAIRLHLCMVDGTRAWFQLSKKSCRELFDFIKENFPGISQGYNRDLARKYRKDPLSLRKNPQLVDGAKESVLTYVHIGWG